MSLVKRTYVDQETVITAENLNAIQDAIIENEEAIEDQGEAIEGKYSKPAGGIPATDMASGVQTSLGKADSAYQKPSGGIPASDMASAVQTSLGKAESAYQKPSGGIPASDMASGVQTSLGKAESAYQKPSGGIPASDMASGVQTSLGKADSAYQKPSGGIPASDMASGVQTSLGKADSAYQKPSGGIPATDMASGVQTSLGKADSALQSSDIDSTLTVAGKAADAKKTGDEISDVKNTLTQLENDTFGNISLTGTNNTGSTITAGTFFYNNGSLVRAKTDIQNGSSITIGTNSETVTAGGLNALKDSLTPLKIVVLINSAYVGPYDSASITVPEGRIFMMMWTPDTGVYTNKKAFSVGRCYNGSIEMFYNELIGATSSNSQNQFTLTGNTGTGGWISAFLI